MEHQPTSDHSSTPPDAFVTEAARKAAHSPDLAEAIARGYEPHDLKLRGIFMFVGVLAVTLFVVLSVIYGIMMAMADYERSTDPLASPITVKLPRVYAPLQPSLGIYGNDANNHLSLDSDDMQLMRETTQEELNAPRGTTFSGRAHMPIDEAIDKALPLLVSREVVKPPDQQVYPPGSYEGHRGDQPIPEKKSGVWSNDMNSLNNQGN